MKALRRSHNSTSPSPPSDSNSPTTSSSSWIHLRSLIIVVSSSPATDRGSLKSPWARRKRKRALSKQQWKSFFTPEGKLRDGGVKFLKKVRSGGIDPSIRAEVWPFLLGVYDMSSTEDERRAIKTERRKEYEKLRSRCQRLLKHSDEGDNEMKGIDEIISAESLIFKEGSDSPDPEDASSAVSSNKQESLDTNSRNLSGISDEGDKKMKGIDEITYAESPILKEGSESPDSEDAFNVTPLLSNKQESLDNNNRDQRGISHDDASAFKSDNLEEDKSETICADASAEEVESGITHVDTSSEVSESSINESSSDEETESMLTSSNVEENMEIDPKHAKNTPKSEKTTEDFATWQRIIRLDAIRANAEWVTHSPIQAAALEDKVLERASSVGLKDYDHLEPCRIYHASRLVVILEAYALYDQEIGYCQGMSDLLSPILAVMEEDGEAFWCFVGFMKKARHNFRLDEVGIRRQLNIVSKIIKFKDSHLYRHLEKLQAEDCFFVYRMVVVLFRRELDFDQTLCLWEVMWADQAAIRAGIGKSAWGRIRSRAPPTDDLLLYAIAACVLQRRKLIIESYNSMDEIIRECNNMTGRLDVWKLLDDAHDLVVNLHEKI